MFAVNFDDKSCKQIRVCVFVAKEFEIREMVFPDTENDMCAVGRVNVIVKRKSLRRGIRLHGLPYQRKISTGDRNDVRLRCHQRPP